jgi:hypothetical protein
MLVALLWLLLAGGDDEPQAVPSTTTAAPTSTTTSTATSTSTSTTTTTSLDPDARVAEVARILEDLEIAWYDAVYRKDESVLPDIVATQRFYDDAVNAMTIADFSAPPSDDTIDVTVYEILLDRDDCLVVYHQLDVSRVLTDAEPSDHVQILWPREGGGYRLVTRWSSPGDLWLQDCDSLSRDEIS